MNRTTDNFYRATAALKHAMEEIGVSPVDIKVVVPLDNLMRLSNALATSAYIIVIPHDMSRVDGEVTFNGIRFSASKERP